MGGYNSGGHNRKHVTVEASVKLDAAMLRRAGLMDATTPKGNYWTYSSNRGQHTCTVLVIAGYEASTLEVTIITPDKAEQRQRIRTNATPCNFGRQRHWLHCPHCGRRVFKLYYYPHTVNQAGQYVHYFACRHCLRLTYQARRERGFDLHQSRCFDAHDRMTDWARVHGVTSYKADRRQWEVPPEKPAGMRWRTYERIAGKWEKAAMQANTSFIEKTAALIERFGKIKR
jgi:hypothetical protein